MPFVYILQCSDASYYVGSTWDLERRVGEHNQGLGAEYTKRRRPVTLIWSEQFPRIDEAYWVEKQIQGWGRKKRQALIEGRFSDLPGLARTAKPREGDPGAVVSTSSTDERADPTDTDAVVSTSSTDERADATDLDAVVSTRSADERADATDTDDVVSTSSTDGAADATNADGVISTSSTDGAR